MTRGEFMQGMRSLPALLDEIGILQQVYSTAPLKASEEFVSCALSMNPQYEDLYRIGLRNRDYNFLLNDYSYLQFAHAGGEDNLSLRFAFYSNPFNPVAFPDVREIADGIDYETYLQLLDEEGERGPSIIVRYDVALGDYVEFRHPASHMHFGLHEDSRWPVDKILTPVAFTLLIAKLFFAGRWLDVFDRRFALAKGKCVALADGFFSERERQHIYIT